MSAEDVRHTRCRECGRFMSRKRWAPPVAEQEERRRNTVHYIPLWLPLCDRCTTHPSDHSA